MEIDFRNAKTRLCKEHKSISGLKIEPEWLIWFELYRDVFCDKLDSLGFTNEDDFVKLLETMDKYNNVGSFLYDGDAQQAEMAAYGLVVFDRILRAEAAHVNHFTVFCMHQELMECYSYHLKGFYEDGIKINRKVELAAAGAIGGKNKNENHNKLRNWVKKNMGNRPTTKVEARKLFAVLPQSLVAVSTDPVRFIHDVLREKD